MRAFCLDSRFTLQTLIFSIFTFMSLREIIVGSLILTVWYFDPFYCTALLKYIFLKIQYPNFSLSPFQSLYSKIRPTKPFTLENGPTYVCLPLISSNQVSLFLKIQSISFSTLEKYNYYLTYFRVKKIKQTYF